MKPYHAVNVDGQEYVLYYRVNKNTWAGVQKNQDDISDFPDTKVEAINAHKCIKLESTYIFDNELLTEPIYFIWWDNLFQVMDNTNMLRQINEHNHTTGCFTCERGLIEWNIADRIWQINGVKHKMHIMTPRGQWFS